ncbi:MAG: carbohydrate ABC transporter permease [Clostridia bacterium]|nr:carbohydrate ABC transporter permease [Clostridia bacterium]
MKTGFGKLDFLFTVIVGAAVLVTIIPFLNVIAMSLSSPEAITRGSVWLWPAGLNAEAYKAVFTDLSMIWALVYTIILTIFYTVLAMILTVLLAYPLTKNRLRGRKFFTFIFVFTMYFSGGVIPEYILFKNLKIINTMTVLVIPGLLSVYNMIILKSFLMGLPASIEESAYLDGASDFCILFKIILPLSKPILATLCLFYAVFRWNTFQDVLYFVTNSKLYTLQLKLNMLINITQSSELTQFEGANPTRIAAENIKSASIIFATVPIVLVYPWLQKYFVTGMTLGAVKE